MTQKTILRIDASAQLTGSVTRDLTDRIIDLLAPSRVIGRDLAQVPLPQIDEDWINANFSAPDTRTQAQMARLVQSDALVQDLQEAETIVIGLPIYNFGVPAALKAWVDLVARAGLTFRYTADGPQGLLTGKRAILAVASGGTEAGSEIDFAVRYMTHVLGFIGITEIDIVAADRMALDPEATLSAAHDRVAQLAA